MGGLLGLSRQANSLRLGLPLLGSVLGWQSLTVVTVATALAAKILPKSGKSSHDAANFGLGLAATGGAALAGHAGVLAVWGPAGAALLAALTTG